MAGLVLKLRPGEEILINGVLVENGDRNARIRVKTEGANILRMREAMKPEDATTPIRQAYYIAQLAVAGQMPGAKAADLLQYAVSSLISEPSERQILCEQIKSRHFYSVMRTLKRIADTHASEEAA